MCEQDVGSVVDGASDGGRNRKERIVVPHGHAQGVELHGPRIGQFTRRRIVFDAAARGFGATEHAHRKFQVFHAASHRTWLKGNRLHPAQGMHQASARKAVAGRFERVNSAEVGGNT